MTDSARVWFTTELLTQSAETTLPIKTQNAAEKERADPHKPSEHSLLFSAKMLKINLCRVNHNDPVRLGGETPPSREEICIFTVMLPLKCCVGFN